MVSIEVPDEAELQSVDDVPAPFGRIGTAKFELPSRQRVKRSRLLGADEASCTDLRVNARLSRNPCDFILVTPLS